MSPPLPVLDAEDIHGYPDDVAMLLQEYGALVVRGAVGPDECARCFLSVELSLHRAMAAAGQISTGDDIHRTVTDEQAAAGHRHFGNVASPPHRRDLKLALSPPVKACLNQLLASVGATLAAILTEDAELCELSALCSDPGAAAQALHPAGRVLSTSTRPTLNRRTESARL